MTAENETTDKPVTAAEMDFKALYVSLCRKHRCRVNSAVAALLGKCPHQPLTRLALGNNYVGAKGFLPILDLIEECQTIEHIDLSGNGLDNSCIAKLCEILQSHLGVTSVKLNHNPLTTEGGKVIMETLERNTRLVEFDVGSTDIFPSLVDRIGMAVAANGGTYQPNLALLRKEREDQKKEREKNLATGRPAPSAVKRNAPTTTPQASTVTLTKVSSTEGVVDGKQDRDEGSAATPISSDGPLKPRPPPPGLASSASSRLSAAQRTEMRKQYDKRVVSLRDAEASSARVTAANMRMELALLEREEARQAAATEQSKPKPPRHPTTAESPVEEREGAVTRGPACDPCPVDTTEADDDDHDAPAPPPRTNSASDQAEQLAAKIAEKNEASYESNKHALSPQKRSELAEAAQEAEKIEASKQVVNKDAEAEARASAPRVDSKATELPELTDAEGELLVGVEARFRQLFNEGSRLYNQRKLEEAYTVWDEAMHVATEAKNREWIAVIAQNIQRLSYELLVNRGTTALDNGDLDEATNCYTMAKEVAVKARNSAWEAEMERQLKNVHHARFQRCHDEATRLFESVVAFEERELDDGDRFEEDGKLLIRTKTFVNVWERMLIVKECVERWSEALQVTHVIGGSASRVLSDVVMSSLNSVCAVLVGLQYVPETNRIPRLVYLGTHPLTGVEREKLSTLWIDLLSTARSINFTRLSCICNGYLGQLAFGLFQLPQALKFFDDQRTEAEEIEDKTLLAASLSFTGSVLILRSEHSEAERALNSALSLWASLRASENNVYITFMHAHMYYLLQQVMTGMYRYNEGLEMCERHRLHMHEDLLYTKMTSNFSPQPTADHITAAARKCAMPIVMYSITYRFDWNIDKAAYDHLEMLHIWVAPPEGDVKYCPIDVKKVVRRESLLVLVDHVLSEFRVRDSTLHELPSSMQLALPQSAWKEPLSLLYRVLIYPIIDFLEIHTKYSDLGCFAVVPDAFLWLVPFPALICGQEEDGSVKFLIEKMVIHHALCATQLSLSALSAIRVRDRAAARRLVLGPCAEAVADMDDKRVYKETLAVAEQLMADVVQVDKRLDESVVAHQLSQCRVLHIPFPMGQQRDEQSGSSFFPLHGEKKLLASTVSTMDIPCEVLSMSSSEFSRDQLVAGEQPPVLEMTRAWLSAGTSTVIGTLWHTPDMSVGDALVDTYAAMAEVAQATPRTAQPHVKPISVALAVRRILRDDEFRFIPRHWAGFFVIGGGLD